MDERYAASCELLPPKLLDNTRITIYGAGRMGSWIAWDLADAGVKDISVWDSDILEKRNILGTPYFEDQVGMPKVEALKEIISRKNSEVNLTVYNEFIELKKLPVQILGKELSDLYVWAIDDDKVVRKGIKSLEMLLPQVRAMVWENCDIGIVAFSIPGVTPSLNKLIDKRQKTIIHAQAIGVHVQQIACLASEICLKLLTYKNSKNGCDNLIDCYMNAPMAVYGIRRKWIFEGNRPDNPRSIYLIGK